MTQWSGRKVVAWALGAGFSAQEAPLAAAVAWAASEGADHYASNPGLTQASERRGLWALRCDQVADSDAHLLWNPDFAAKAAHSLYIEAGGNWLWHPVAISGAADRALPLITAIIKHPRDTITDNPQVTMLNLLRRASSLHSQIQATARRG